MRLFLANERRFYGLIFALVANAADADDLLQDISAGMWEHFDQFVPGTDFAAWAWQKAGVRLIYGYAPGQINGGAASFYDWGVAHGQWHPATSGYRPAPGDVAVYGLSVGADPSAAHVAIVTDAQTIIHASGHTMLVSRERLRDA